jgi:purine nucleoside phosphorylase
MVRDVRAAARKIKTILKSEPKIGVILGSGLIPVASSMRISLIFHTPP